MRYNINNNERSGCVFFDLSTAFDTVEHEILLKNGKIWSSMFLLGLVKSNLIERKQGFFHKKFSIKTRAMKRGVPQGSVVGTILF